VITFTLEELKGVPDDVISGYTKHTEDGKDMYDVTHKTPDIFPVVRTYYSEQRDLFLNHILQFKFAQHPETRRRAHESYEARLAINVPLLDKALELRRKIASLLGYPTWADYITEVKMIKNARGVTEVRSCLVPWHRMF
jgi:Zn-dependent oligopeptidase